MVIVVISVMYVTVRESMESIENTESVLKPLLVSRIMAAVLLGICPRTLDSLAAQRVLRPKRIGKRVLCVVAELEKYAAAR
jgi:hypothetical protein